MISVALCCPNTGGSRTPSFVDSGSTIANLINKVCPGVDPSSMSYNVNGRTVDANYVLEEDDCVIGTLHDLKGA